MATNKGLLRANKLALKLSQQHAAVNWQAANARETSFILWQMPAQQHQQWSCYTHKNSRLLLLFINETTAMSVSLHSLIKQCILLHPYLESGTERFVAQSHFPTQHWLSVCQAHVPLLLKYKTVMGLKLMGVRRTWIQPKIQLNMEWMHYCRTTSTTNHHQYKAFSLCLDNVSICNILFISRHKAHDFRKEKTLNVLYLHEYNKSFFFSSVVSEHTLHYILDQVRL